MQSAFATTRGGALRYLQRYAEALASGERAHLLQPRDFRPCTLLGAIHIEQRDFVTGREWFIKAEKLGASRGIVDRDIKASLERLPPAERNRLLAFLLSQDPERFSWASAGQRRSHKANQLR